MFIRIGLCCLSSLSLINAFELQINESKQHQTMVGLGAYGAQIPWFRKGHQDTTTLLSNASSTNWAFRFCVLKSPAANPPTTTTTQTSPI